MSLRTRRPACVKEERAPLLGLPEGSAKRPQTFFFFFVAFFAFFLPAFFAAFFFFFAAM